MQFDQDLWSRIEAFDIDGVDRPAQPFAERLAKDNDWSRAFAVRVIGEYKRYVYLATTAGHPVCPSDQVDEAWHLHLTYSRSYWQRFCKETLGRDLHHEPTQGGADEDAKHWQMYEETLSAYREAFGAEAPPDIWPPVSKRFPAFKRQRMPALALLSVNPSAILLVVSFAIAGWTLSGSLNPFELVGAKFLLVLIPAMILAIAAGRLVYAWARMRGVPKIRRFTPLDWQEAAYVAGGTGRLSSAIMAKLVADGHIRVSDDRKQLVRTSKSAEGLGPIEAVALRHMPIAKGTSSTGTQFKRMEADIERDFRRQRNALEASGVAINDRQLFLAWMAALIPFGAVLVFLALPRLGAGLASNRPVFFLVMTMVIGTVIALFCARPMPHHHRTREGDALLERMQGENKALEKGHGIEPSAGVALGAAAGLGVALFGMSALAGSSIPELSDLDVFLPARHNQTSGCGGGCGTSSGGGDGGGDGGGGGCGGGGD